MMLYEYLSLSMIDRYCSHTVNRPTDDNHKTLYSFSRTIRSSVRVRLSRRNSNRMLAKKAVTIKRNLYHRSWCCFLAVSFTPSGWGNGNSTEPFLSSSHSLALLAAEERRQCGKAHTGVGRSISSTIASYYRHVCYYATPTRTEPS